MTKEFIPYEQALELKELGFDEECLTYYFKEHKELFFGSKPAYGEVIDAPLYQQAFRWFREKHQLFSWVKVEYEYGGYSCGIYITGVRQSDIANGSYSTYEEAELACIKKLIEIVKNKQQ